MLSGTSYVIGPCVIQVKYNFQGSSPGFVVSDLHEFKRTTPEDARNLAMQLLADSDYPDDIEISVLCIELSGGGGTARRPCAIYRRKSSEQTRKA